MTAYASGCANKGVLPGGPSGNQLRPQNTTTIDYQHVWVHYDYMVFPNGITAPLPGLLSEPPGFTTAPDPAAIQLVVNAYAAQGIILHIDPQHTAIPGHLDLIPDFSDYPPQPSFCSGTDAANFSTLKAQYFHPNSNHPWHYAIWGYYIGSNPWVIQDPSTCPIFSGFAELPGYDFAVGFGLIYDFGPISPPFDPYFLGGGFMHELGHNLGLRHGGFEDLPNYKPNYISVMNYLFNFGIPYGDVNSSPPTFNCCRLDYSHAALTLDQSNLNEFVGVNYGTSDTTAFTCGAQTSHPGLLHAVNSTGPIDWDCDGTLNSYAVFNDPTLSSDVQASILDYNCLAVLPGFSQTDCFYPGIVTGFDDWSYLHQVLGLSPDLANRLTKKLHLDTFPGLDNSSKGDLRQRVRAVLLRPMNERYR